MDRRRIVNQVKARGITGKTGNFAVKGELGSGGNGVAFLCRTDENEPVVAKVYIPPDSRDLDEQAYKRFKNEISLITKIRHPNIVRALDSGIVKISAYSLPFYVMPLAEGTLRMQIGIAADSDILEKNLRTFLRASLGVACLHSNGIIHRDLKPENILIGKDGAPWIADLGIARVTSQLATTGVKTIASDKLRNQDYYAPEQRFGSALDVDHRADIYALGLILYELVAGTPPVRISAPRLQSIAEAFTPLDPIIDRMTAYERDQRYKGIEDVVEDLAVAIGWILANYKGDRVPLRTDLPTMIKLLKSLNSTNRQRGMEIAQRLGPSALDALYDLLGHARREIRNSAAVALGKIADVSSLRHLVGALYGNSDSPTRFRPSADTAAQAIAQYAIPERLRALPLIAEPIRPQQILEILKEVPPPQAYDAVLTLFDKNLILLEWGETTAEVLTQIDEERAWPEIKKAIEDNDIRSSFRVKGFIGYLSTPHQQELVNLWLHQDKDDHYSFENMLDIIKGLPGDEITRRLFLSRLESQVRSYRGVLRDRPRLLQRIEIAQRQSSPIEEFSYEDFFDDET